MQQSSLTALVACALMCCALTLPAALAQVSDLEEVLRRREEQELLACELRINDTLNEEFFSSANTDPNTDTANFRILLAAVGHDSVERCFSVRDCPGAPVTWCVHLYHPVDSISLCYNDSGHVVNITAAADQLRLQDKFEIQPEECSKDWPGCITLKSVEYFMSYSYLTCTAASPTCYHQTGYKTKVVASREHAEIPKIDLDNNTNLFLNETNIFVCTSSLSGDPVPLHYSTWWEVDNVRVSDSVHYNPHCGTDISLSEQECRDANEASGATRERIRVHQFLYAQRYCPHPNVVIRVWLVIENATAEDAKKSYECHSIYTAINPSFQLVPHHEIFNIQPVYPLVDVVPIERPTSSPDLSYLLNSNESLEWSCSVQAGLQDRLIWTHEGEEILDVDLESVHNLTNVTEGVYDSSSVENITCSSLQSIGDRVVVSETKTVSGYRRQFRSTLFICGTSERILGRYECLLRRERRDEKDVPIWSAILTTPETTEGPDTGTPFISQLKIIISVSVITSFVVIVFAVTIIALCVRRKRASKQKHTEWKLAMGTLSVTEDILLDGFRRHNSLRKKDSLGPVTIEENDPLEFPRDKLVLLDRILGEGTFGVVRQARAEGIVESTPERNIVAVKTTKPKAPPHELNNFWEELQLMKNMEPQENLVNLLGYCTSPGGPIYMIIEYANHGSLKDFLKSCEEAVTKLHHTPQFRIYRSRRTSSASTCSTRYPQQICRQSVSAQNSVFSNLGTPTTATTTASSSGNFDFSSTPALHDALTRDRLITQDSGFFGESASQATFNDVLAITPTSNMAHMIAPLTHDYVNSKGLLYMEDIQNFALQIACGLKHLEESQIVHCDLAARNILIAEGFVLKIGDFGMARDVSEKEYYRKQGGRIPVKWTAPEALKDHIFTYKSDIWSFGVVLWEILTYGQQPYPKLKVRHSWESFIKYLMEGNRLPQPKGCPDNFYDLMLSCWHSSSDQRPSAEDLVQFLSQKNLLPINNTGVDSTTVHSSDPDKTLHTTESSLSPQCHV